MDFDSIDSFWKVFTPVAAVGGFIIKGLYTSGRQYNALLNKMDQNSITLGEVRSDVSKMKTALDNDRAKNIERHNSLHTRVAILENQSG